MAPEGANFISRGEGRLGELLKSYRHQGDANLKQITSKKALINERFTLRLIYDNLLVLKAIVPS